MSTTLNQNTPAAAGTPPSGVPTQAVADAVPAPRSTARDPRKGVKRRIIIGILVLIALIAGAWFGTREIIFNLGHEDTDDAQIAGHLDPVFARVGGYVTAVLVRDNQRVAAGQPLLRIDTRDYDAKIETAQAALANARAAAAAAQAAVAVAQANADTAAITMRLAAADLARDRGLFTTKAIPDKEFTDSTAAAATAVAQHTARLEQVAAARSQVALAETVIAQRQADLDYARLQRSYTEVTAPDAGVVSRKNVELGQLVQPGQALLSIANDRNVWVVANFKETQMTDIRTGQSAVVEVDAYPGVDFRGHVDSIAGATGAVFALLPPDNATGNFVKVTQRVPVKIVFDGPTDPAHVLRPGLSVTATIATKAR